MGATEHLTIAVPAEMAARMREWVAAGEFANLDELVMSALRGLDEAEVPVGEISLDDLIRRKVVPAIEAYRRDPSRGMTVEQVLENLAAARARRAADA